MFGVFKKVEVVNYPEKGRGLRALEEIASGELIERCPVMVFPLEFSSIVLRTDEYDKFLGWERSDRSIQTVAIALGLSALCNHSSSPNARLYRSIEIKYVELIASRKIKLYQEIEIKYLVPRANYRDD